MHHAILAMGFWPTVRIVKTRRTATFGDLVVCVDELDGLGVFLEVERMVPGGMAGEAVQEELSLFVVSLGIEAEQTGQTYDSLMRALVLPQAECGPGPAGGSSAVQKSVAGAVAVAGPDAASAGGGCTVRPTVSAEWSDSLLVRGSCRYWQLRYRGRQDGGAERMVVPVPVAGSPDPAGTLGRGRVQLPDALVKPCSAIRAR